MRTPRHQPPDAGDDVLTQPHYSLHPLLRAYAREQTTTLNHTRYEGATRGIVPYAVHYAERYRGDLARLEAEQGTLLAAVRLAADAQEHTRTLTLARALLGIAGRTGLDSEGERALLLGARAAFELHDRYGMVHMLTRLGTLHFYRGAFRSARRLWHDALAHAEGLGDQPYTRLAVRWNGFLAASRGEQDEALRCASAYVETCQDADTAYAYVGSLVSRSFQYRVMGERDKAMDDTSACLELIARERHPDTLALTGQVGIQERIVDLEAQIELARLSGDYAQAYEQSTAVFPLLEAARDRFFLADAMLDQAEFALTQEERADAATLAHEAREVATLAGVPYLRARAERILACL